MSQRRMLILIGALVVGVIAALLMLQYVGTVEEQAQGSTKTEKMVVATASIAKGAVGTDLVQLADRRVNDRPQNAISKVEDIKNLIAAIDIAPGTVITTAMFVNPNELKESNSEVLEKNMTALTVSFDPIKGVAGLVKPGDYVNILASDAVCESQDIMRDKSEANVKGSKCTGYLYQKAKVLAIGRSFGGPVAAQPASTDGAPTTTAAPTVSDQVTFAVPPEAAQMIAFFSPGSLYLSLVRDDYEPHPIPILIDFVNPPGGNQGQTPVGVDPEKSTTTPTSTDPSGK